jgi:plastocyanin
MGKRVRWWAISAAATSMIVMLFALAPPTDGLTGAAGVREEPLAGEATSSQVTGSISGAVRFVGSPPDAAILEMAADPFCLTAHQGETVTADNVVVNDNGTLRWVFVYVRDPGAVGRSALPSAVELNQVACVYQPRVLGMQAGATIKITNSDNTLHNVNVQAANNPSFNFAQPIPGMSIERSFAAPEVMIPVKCDVHGWMRAYIGVLPHPYFAVTAENGAFDISGLAPGDYVVDAWHETLGTRTLNVSVAAGAAANADFRFGNER